MTDLKSHLDASGIDTQTWRPLRDLVDPSTMSRGDLPATEVEKKYPLYTLETSISESFPLWERLKPIAEAVGYYPVIVGERKNSIRLLLEGRAAAKTPEAYIAASQSLNVRQWFDDAYKDYYAYDESFTEADILGGWEAISPTTTFDITMYGTVRSQQYIAFFPTVTSWETPAYIGYGNWNACPSADIHVGIHQYWHTLYDTEIIALINDIVICRVNNPVTDKDAALALAKDQMMYCDDIVNQGFGTLKALASSLIGSTYWSFWWD
ncbi:MAG: DUF4253 domain-containing protein [Chloroflexota bacterium]